MPSARETKVEDGTALEKNVEKQSDDGFDFPETKGIVCVLDSRLR